MIQCEKYRGSDGKCLSFVKDMAVDGLVTTLRKSPVPRTQPKSQKDQTPPTTTLIDRAVRVAR